MRLAESTTINPLELLECYCQAARKVLPSKRRIYTDTLVIYLMVIQFVRNCSMERVLQDLTIPALKKLQGSCKRVEETHQLSTNPSAYWQAWQGVEEEKILSLLAETHRIINGQNDNEERQIVLLDGTTFELPPTDKLRAEYPPHIAKGAGKKGSSVFPQILVLNAHDLNTGCAITSEFGAKYGKNAENEINLAHKIIPRFAPGSIIVGDKFFGVHSVVYQAQSLGHYVVLSMTEVRMKSLLRRAGVEDRGFIDQPFTWTTSTFEKLKNKDKGEKPIEARLIVVDIKQEKKIRLYLVTTLLDVSAQEVIELYARRWEIEIDFRNIKQSTNMKELASKSPKLIRKEILAGLIAHNLVRAVMLLAAKKHGKDPKRLGYIYALDAFKSYLPSIARARSGAERKRLFEELLDMVAAKVNKIRKREPYPRQVYVRRRKYDIHQAQRADL